MPSWKKIIQSGSDAHLSKITASTMRISSIEFDDGVLTSAGEGGGAQNLFSTISSSGAGTSGSFTATSATDTLNFIAGDNITISASNDSIIISSSGGGVSSFTDLTDVPDFTLTNNSASLTDITASGNISASGNIKTTNINVGVPTSNDWQTNLEGSFFNNFDSNTDVSEILRFVAGLLSSSAASPTENTRIYNSLNENTSNTTTSTISNAGLSGRVPQNSTTDDIIYLINKGFASTGGTLFPGKTITTNTNYAVSYTSDATGTTTVSSDATDQELFGLGGLSSGNPVEFRVSGSHIFTFSSASDEVINENSSSGKILTNSSFGTSNGLTLSKILTDNPAVIPSAFQDGKFVSVHSQGVLGWTTQDNSSVSSSGKYTITSSIGIATGSQSDYTVKEKKREIFYAPLSNLNTRIGTNTLSVSNVASSSLTLTSGSLSGAPFINGGTWDLQFTASGVFNPMYATSTTLVDVTIGITSGYTISKTSGEDTLSTSGGTIQTSGLVKSSDGATSRNSGVPHETDKAHIDATYSISGTGGTFNESGFSDTSYTLALKSRNRASAQTTIETKTMNLHAPGQFNQPVASGSMGYFGGGATSTTKLIERFFDETYRRVISSPTALTTAWDSTTRLTLGDGGDLQVKPGYLVNPESANGYFYPTDNYNASHYKWYLREVETDVTSNKGTLTINLDPNSSNDLVTFDDTTNNKIAIGVIFEATNGVIFDAVKGNNSYNNSLDGTSPSTQLNPFDSNVDIVGDFSSLTNSSGTLTLGLQNAAGQTINASDEKIWLLIRYKGTPSNTLERITVSTS